MTNLDYRKALDSVLPYIPGKAVDELRQELGLERIIKLASNESPFGFSPKVRAAAADALDNASMYPDGHCVRLKNELAGKFGLDAAQFVIGAGSFELILFAAETFINPGDESIIPTPTFGWYGTVTRLMQGVVAELPLKGYRIDLDAVSSNINEKTKIVWLCNPNNPTGTIFTGGELEAFLKGIPPKVIVVLDEAYADYVADRNYPRSIELLDRYPNIIVLRTFSKIHGLASLRVGFAAADPEIAGYMNRVRQIFNVNALAQASAIASLKDAEFIGESRRRNRNGLEFLFAAFVRLGLEFIPSEANFVMVRTGKDGLEIYQKLLQKGVIIRPGNHFRMPEWLRISVGTEEQNEIFINALEEVLKD